MYLCLSDDNFLNTSCRKFVFTHPVYLQAIQVKFVYEGHWVKVKVTGPKKVHNRYTHNGCLRVTVSVQCENSIANIVLYCIV